MSIQPRGDDLRKAVRWIAEQAREDPAGDRENLGARAAIKFNLSPKDSEFLLRFIAEKSVNL
ncbi:MAG: hypothetical protein JRI38_05005 [Deltaproteobacteria bacterium]|nr:hypothetical protein [Deltaproteobacteria bacterium]